jgi:hypothetical protein
VRTSHCWMASIGLGSLVTAAVAGIALADGPQPPIAPVPAPALPPDLARQVQEITEVVLENHIDPPARQQMVLSGIKALAGVAGVPTPPGLGRRVSEITTPEQLAALLKEVWPKTTSKPIAAKKLEEALFEGLLVPIPGGAQLMTPKERNAAEQLAGNRYVGILVALRQDEKEQRPVFQEVMASIPRAWRCARSSSERAATRGPTSPSRSGAPRRRRPGRSGSPGAGRRRISYFMRPSRASASSRRAIGRSGSTCRTPSAT